jgi:hypothetical protein
MLCTFHHVSVVRCQGIPIDSVKVKHIPDEAGAYAIAPNEFVNVYFHSLAAYFRRDDVTLMRHIGPSIAEP